MVLLVTDRWVEQTVDLPPQKASSVRTIWIDLSAGREAVWKNLDKQWRYGVGRARQLGVTVDVATHPDEIAQFAALCSAVADRKGFVLPGSKPLMEELL
jgi:lipid II:glycine glycyltransferase (peptidoglycan interpeptide bridge formation enzyme)